MKSILSLIALFMSVMLFAQTSAPQHFNYQSLIRNNDGTYVANSAVYVRISIIENGPAGTVIYSEVHQTTTNDYGLINLKIGQGTTSDDFTNIEWGAATLFVKVEASINNDQSYFEVSVSPFSSVPYALYAEKTASAYQVPTGTGVLSFNPEAPDGYGFSGNTLTTQKTVGEWSDFGNMQLARRYAAVTGGVSTIFVIGGESALDELMSAAEFYSSQSGTWTSIANFPEGVKLAAADSLNSYIYVSGGITTSASSGSNKLRLYNQASDEWLEKATMNNPRRSHGLIAYKEHLYAIGGLNGSTIVNSVEKYNPTLDQWTEVTTIPQSIFGARYVLLGSKIFVIGGKINDVFSTTVLSYNIETGMWKEEASIQTPRRDFGACAGNGYIMITGGQDDDDFIAKTEVYSEKLKQWVEVESLTTAKSALNATFFNGYHTILNGQTSPSGSKLSNLEKLSIQEIDETIFLHLAQ